MYIRLIDEEFCHEYSFQSLENVFLHLCRDDQTRNNQKNTTDQENLDNPTSDIDHPPISPIQLTNGETPPFSQIRKKELVKNRRLTR